MSFQEIQALVKKEALQAYKDPSTIFLFAVYPAIILFLFGFGVNLDLKNINIGLVAEDTSPISRDFIRSLSFNPYFSVLYADDVKQAESWLATANIDTIVVIPSYFTEYFLDKNKTAPIQVIADGSSPNTAQLVQNYIKSTWLNWNNKTGIENDEHPVSSVVLDPRMWYNQEMYSRYFILPGSIGEVLLILGGLLTSFVVAREWERGSMELLMSTPVSMESIIIGKFIFYFALSLVSAGFCYVIVHDFYGIPFRGSLFSYWLTCAVYLSFVIGFGLMISLSLHDQFIAGQTTAAVFFMPSLLLSGQIFDIDNMPIYLRIISYFIPARYFMENIKTVFLVGDVWSIIFSNILFLCIFLVVILLVLKIICVKRVD